MNPAMAHTPKPMPSHWRIIWWRGDRGHYRDYYRMIDGEERSYWVFKDGEGRCFIHGIYA